MGTGVLFPGVKRLERAVIHPHPLPRLGINVATCLTNELLRAVLHEKLIGPHLFKKFFGF
jgi:hypothetical protein